MSSNTVLDVRIQRLAGELFGQLEATHNEFLRLMSPRFGLNFVPKSLRIGTHRYASYSKAEGGGMVIHVWDPDSDERESIDLWRAYVEKAVLTCAHETGHYLFDVAGFKASSLGCIEESFVEIAALNFLDCVGRFPEEVIAYTEEYKLYSGDKTILDKLLSFDPETIDLIRRKVWK